MRIDINSLSIIILIAVNAASLNYLPETKHEDIWLVYKSSFVSFIIFSYISTRMLLLVAAAKEKCDVWEAVKVQLMVDELALAYSAIRRLKIDFIFSLNSLKTWARIVRSHDQEQQLLKFRKPGWTMPSGNTW